MPDATAYATSAPNTAPATAEIRHSLNDPMKQLRATGLNRVDTLPKFQAPLGFLKASTIRMPVGQSRKTPT